MFQERALSRIHEVLVCGVCAGRLRQPKILTQCSHTFCQSCLETVLANQSAEADQLECPKCHKVMSVPQGKIENLPTNYTLQNVAAIVSEAPESDGQEPQPVCQEHQNVLNQYCSACNQLLCSECIHDPKHIEHLQRGEIHLARDILPKHLQTLSLRLEEASELASHVGRLQEDLDKKKEAISNSSVETKREIESFFRAMAEHLEERRKLLVSAVETNTNSKLAALDKHHERLKEIQEVTVSDTDVVKRLCRSQSIHALTEGKAIDEDLQQSRESLKTIDVQLQDRALTHVLKFQGDGRLEQQISMLGYLTVCEREPDSGCLTVRHQLRVGRGGNVFMNPPPNASTQQVSMYDLLGASDDAYVPMVPSGRATPTTTEPISPVPYEVPRSLISPQSQQESNPLSQSPGRPRATNRRGSEYENVASAFSQVGGKPVSPGPIRARAATAPQRSTDRIHLQEASRVLLAGARDDDSDAPSEEDHYEVIQPPPLPPDNLYRSMGQTSGRASPLRNSLYASVARPTNRREPEIILPVKVIGSDHLREPESNNEVYPTGICVSSSDIITITDLHNHCLRQIDQDGMFIQTFGRKGKAIWDFNSPTAVVLSADHLYVTNHANGLAQKLTVDGEYVATFGRKRLQTPRGIAISQLSGNIYVSDSKKQRVYVYRSNCTYERPIGKYESDIKFEHPVGVVFDTAGNLLVVDRGHVPCIWHISQPDGVLLGKIGEGYLHYPSDVTATKDGSIVVTERGKMNCVSVFSPQGNVIRCFGKTGSKPGEFNGPSGVAVNSQGQIVVADQYNQRLQIFDLDPANGVKDSRSKSPTPNV